jgi:hypothetical protein
MPLTTLCYINMNYNRIILHLIYAKLSSWTVKVEDISSIEISPEGSIVHTELGTNVYVVETPEEIALMMDAS